MHACAYECTCVRMHVCINVCIYECMYVCMYVCIFVGIYKHTCEYLCNIIITYALYNNHVGMHESCTYVSCMCVLYEYMHVCMHT